MEKKSHTPYRVYNPSKRIKTNKQSIHIQFYDINQSHAFIPMGYEMNNKPCKKKLAHPRMVLIC